MISVDEIDGLCHGLVIDNGSLALKAGFAGDDAPRSIFRSVVGRPIDDGIIFLSLFYLFYLFILGPKQGGNAPGSYVGSEAQARRDILALKYPIVRGKVTEWDDMERIWDYTFRTALNTSPEEQPVLLSEQVFSPKPNREKMTQIMFESFNTPAFYVSLDNILAMYASGRNTGMVVSCGEGCLTTTAMWEGCLFETSVHRVDIGGSDITDYFTAELNKRYALSPADFETVRDIKERLGYVALDYDAELKNPAELPYELPDGSTVTVGNECFQGPEALFQPTLVGLESETQGIHQLARSSILRCPLDSRKDLFDNIVLCGGSTMFPGMQERLSEELKRLVPSSMDVKVVAPPERVNSTWIGGSILASLASFDKKWITRDEYAEVGPSIVHRKCLYV